MGGRRQVESPGGRYQWPGKYVEGPDRTARRRKPRQADDQGVGVRSGRGRAVVCVLSVFPRRSASQFSNRSITTKNVATNSTARQVEAIIPLNTVMPIGLRARAPGPPATTSGATPRMKANDVIRIGRNQGIRNFTSVEAAAPPTTIR